VGHAVKPSAALADVLWITLTSVTRRQAALGHERIARVTSKLLEKKRNAQPIAVVPDVARPLGLHHASERVKESIFSLESGHRAPSWMNGRHYG
jgi:hypothetical protein